MAPGRKRKPGKRYPCGKRTRQELEKDAMSVAIDARRRHFGVTAKQAKDERLGTALGRLAFREMISETQYQAGVAFAQLYRDHHATVGLPSPSPRSVAGLLINEGIFGASPSTGCLLASGRPCWSTRSSAPTRMPCTGAKTTSGTSGWR